MNFEQHTSSNQIGHPPGGLRPSAKDRGDDSAIQALKERLGAIVSDNERCLDRIMAFHIRMCGPAPARDPMQKQQVGPSHIGELNAGLEALFAQTIRLSELATALEQIG